MSLKFSIITVTYNAQETIAQTLRSVLEQNYPNIEYVVVDGGSTDNTLQIIEPFKSRLAKFISEKDNGLYDALNKGITMASGDIVGILHADDFYTSKQVISRYAQLFESTGCDAAYSDLYYVDKYNTDKIIRRWKSGYYTTGAFVNGWMPPHPTFFVKRSLYNKLGTFNLEFKTAADYELMLRFIHKNNVKLAYLPEFTVKMRMGGQSNVSVQNRVNANLEDRKAWEVNNLKPRFYTLYLKPLRKIVQFFAK